MIRFKHKLEYVHFNKGYSDLGESIMSVIEVHEKKGWEHYDTIISPTFSKDRMAFLYFKRQLVPKAKTDLGDIKKRLGIAP